MTRANKGGKTTAMSLRASDILDLVVSLVDTLDSSVTNVFWSKNVPTETMTLLLELLETLLLLMGISWLVVSWGLPTLIGDVGCTALQPP